MIGDLCLLIESLCKTKLGLQGTKVQYGDIYKKLTEQKIYSGWSKKPINSSDFQGNALESTLKKIFKNDYQSKDSIENSYYLSWGLRNNFHHNIESMTFLRQQFKSIIQKQMHFFFDYTINH
jgi:hemolysin activation/secretion protein